MAADDVPSTLTYAAWANAFTAAEAEAIERLGDALNPDQAAIVGRPDGGLHKNIRVTRTAWMEDNAQTKWIYVPAA